ncbi:hypothetical protein [Yoonia sp. BS5-3]|uniref:Uncharacterized protein n=1 Tax=Yoonia phaeophyticola TaxID=3137369 RepID=A0ABZ2V7C6_9RHOB
MLTGHDIYAVLVAALCDHAICMTLATPDFTADTSAYDHIPDDATHIPD